MRKYLSFVLLGILTLVGIGGAALGIVQGTNVTGLGQAVTNTLKAPSYSEHLVENTPQGNQTASLDYQAPDRLGGWIESAGHRTYLFIIGSTQYVSVTRSSKDTTTPLTFSSQQTQGALAVDPAHTYLPYWNCKGATPCPSSRSGSATTVTVAQGGQSVKLTYTVTGNSVSNFTALEQGASINLGLSNVGSAPKVALPAGAKVVVAPRPSAGG